MMLSTRRFIFKAPLLCSTLRRERLLPHKMDFIGRLRLHELMERARRRAISVFSSEVGRGLEPT